MKNSKSVKIGSVIAATIFILLIITQPGACTAGAAEGIILSGRVIVPALFPFTAYVLFLMKSGAANLLWFAEPFTKKIFGLNADLFSVMLLSFLGGYPVGAKLLNEAVKENRISPEDAGVMLHYCVNAGPAFVILAVGGGMLSSKTIGYLLLAAHILPSLLLSIFFGFHLKKSHLPAGRAETRADAADNFVSAVSEAASTVFSICAFVILFSTVQSYLALFSQTLPFLKYLSALLEVTNGASSAKSIPAVAFLLGFAGVCVWCQILSVGRQIKIRFFGFVLFRVVHGLLSAGFAVLFLKVCGIALTVSTPVRFAPTYGGTALSLSSLCMVLVLMITVYTKKSTGKLLEDIV